MFVQGTVKGGGGRLGEGKSVLFRISFLLLLRFVLFFCKLFLFTLVVKRERERVPAALASR